MDQMTWCKLSWKKGSLCYNDGEDTDDVLTASSISSCFCYNSLSASFCYICLYLHLLYLGHVAIGILDKVISFVVVVQAFLHILEPLSSLSMK